ncbi:hypothetical protein L7F22_012249 [Adiantum nelumboides]|nr:hypothetical protein [Adiantum nelumboides]
MAASAPVLGTPQDAPRPITWTYELTPEDETEMQTAIEHFSGRTPVGRLVGTTPSRPTVREWIESALGGSTARILELSMMSAGLFLLQLSDSVSTDALLARSPISSGSRLLVFQRWTPQLDQDEFDRQQQIPRFPVTLSFPSLPIFMRRCLPRMAARWGIVIPGSLVSEIGTPRIQVYAPGDTQFPDLVHIRDRAGQIRAQRMVVTGSMPLAALYTQFLQSRGSMPFGSLVRGLRASVCTFLTGRHLPGHLSGFKDDYVQYFVRRPTRRAPIINRGYYARWASIRKLLMQFLEMGMSSSDGHPKTQILSLGAGFDTLYFQLQEECQAPHLFVELDFKEVHFHVLMCYFS